MPQNNAFYEYLTARDYLGLYATFKGVALSQIKKRVDTMIFKLEPRKKLVSPMTSASEVTLIQENFEQEITVRISLLFKDIYKLLAPTSTLVCPMQSVVRLKT